MTKRIEIITIVATDKQEPIELELELLPPDDQNRIRVLTIINNRAYNFYAYDYFSALCSLRGTIDRLAFFFAAMVLAAKSIHHDCLDKWVMEERHTRYL